MGSLLDAALFAYGQNPIPGARILQTATQSIGTSTNTTAVFGAVDYDTSGTAIADLANNRLIANRTGLWTVTFTCRMQTNASTAERAVGIFRNGNISDRVTGQNGNANYPALNCATTLRMATGDYVQALLWQATGGTISTDLSFEPCCLTATFNGPA